MKMLNQETKNKFINIVKEIKSFDCSLFTKIQKRIDKIISHKQLCICETDQYFIDDVLDHMLDFCKGKKNSPLLKRVTNKQLQEYQNVFSDTLNTVYDDFKPYKIFETDSYIINSFFYKNKPLNELSVNAIVNNKISNSTDVKEVEEHRFYENNVIYIIKPKQYHFWLKSIAVRDVNEVFTDLVKMGY